MTFDENMPFEVIVWDLCERFGWTYEYAEGISLARLAEFTQVQDGKAHARNSLFNKKGR